MAFLNGCWLISFWGDRPVARPLLHTRKVRKNKDKNPCLLGSKSKEVIGNWNKLHSQDLHDLHSLPKINRMFKYDGWDWRGKWHVWGEGRGVYRVLLGNMREREHLEDLGVDGSVMVKWAFKNSDGRAWPGLIWLGMGTADRLLWTRYGSPGTIKSGEFPDQLQYFLDKDSVPQSQLRACSKWHSKPRAEFERKDQCDQHVANCTETKPVICGVIAFKQPNICQLLFELHISVIWPNV
jgi:hypothetical protein